MAREDLHFRLRIPEPLKQRVEAAAKSNHRSMTAEIVATLEEAYPPEGDFAERLAAVVSGLLDEIRSKDVPKDDLSQIQKALKSLDEVDKSDVDAHLMALKHLVATLTAISIRN